MKELKKVFKYLLSDYVDLAVWVFTVLFTAIFLSGFSPAGYWLLICSVYIFAQIMRRGVVEENQCYWKEKYYNHLRCGSSSPVKDSRQNANKFPEETTNEC